MDDGEPALAQMKYLFKLNPYNQQRQFEKPVWVYPAHLAMYATYLRNNGQEVNWGGDEFFYPINYPFNMTLNPYFDKVITTDDQITIPFEKLPFPDRTFTDAKNKRWQSYGNYKFHPATHMMASNLCWYGKCTFCIDTKKLETEPRGLRSVDHVIEEIDDLIKNGYREVFDDSGTFPVGEWLEEFCAKMNSSSMTVGCRKDHIKIGCNMKPVNIDYKMMANAGFRFILVGLESANQETLDRIQKGQKANTQEIYIQKMSEAGLEPHLTTMFGYEWELHKDAMNTVNMVHRLLKKGYAKTAQASVYSPPRTKPDPSSKGHKYIPKIYDAYKSPQFWYHKIKDIRCIEDITYLIRGARLVVEEKMRKTFR